MDLAADGFGHWLAGFIDGEGCFYFHKHRTQFSPPRFQLKLRADDRDILEECVSRTGLGYVIHNPRSGPTNPQSKWLINGRDECVALVGILDQFPLRAKKRRDFDIWRQAVLLWAKQRKTGRRGGGTHGFPDAAEIDALRHQLTEGRRYGTA